MKQRKIILTIILLGLILAGVAGWRNTSDVFAQDNPTTTPTPPANPTPPIIGLTPTNPPPAPTGTPAATATPGGGGNIPPDRFEPNDNIGEATVIGLVYEPDLTLVDTDQDYFTEYLKQGQIMRLSTYVNGVDTQVTVYWDGQIVAQNDDRSPSDPGSTVTFAAVADGWYIAQIEQVGAFDGYYDLEAALTDPTPTPTPQATATFAPTPTPIPTATPLVPTDLGEPNNSPELAYAIVPGVQGNYAVGANDPADHYTFIAKAATQYSCETNTNQVDTFLEVWSTSGELVAVNDDRETGRVDSYASWEADVEQSVIVKITARGNTFGSYTLLCMASALAPVYIPPPTDISSAPGDVITDSNSITPTNSIPLIVRPAGQVFAQDEIPTTHIRLLIYYDANNDRQPSPGEGVANVSVVAVNAQGQRIARVFTNAQGEAIFNLSTTEVNRVVVPFVSSWFAQVRVGEVNQVVLGLPAVRIPIFIPIVEPITED
jgi:hypothetical protein